VEIINYEAVLVKRTYRPVTRCFLMSWSQNSLLFFSGSENTYAHSHVRKSQIKLNSEITSQVVVVSLTLRNPIHEHSLYTSQEKRHISSIKYTQLMPLRETIYDCW